MTFVQPALIYICFELVPMVLVSLLSLLTQNYAGRYNVLLDIFNYSSLTRRLLHYSGTTYLPVCLCMCDEYSESRDGQIVFWGFWIAARSSDRSRSIIKHSFRRASVIYISHVTSSTRRDRLLSPLALVSYAPNHMNTQQLCARQCTHRRTLTIAARIYRKLQQSANTRFRGHLNRASIAYLDCCTARLEQLAHQPEIMRIV